MPQQNRATQSERQARQAPQPSEEQEPSHAPEPPNRVRPVHVERIGGIRAAVWANDGGATGVFYAVTFSRIYKDGQNQWQSSDRFGRDDLLVLAKVADRAHSWICDMLQAPGPPV